MEAEASLAADLSTEISNREDAVSSLDTAYQDADSSLAADLSTEIDALADPDGVTIELDEATNTIRLMETVAAPDSGLRTFEGDMEVNGILTVGGVDVMAHPVVHAKSAAKKFGGKWEDYIAIEEWFDETKAWIGHSMHRMFRHHSEGIFA